ncbi:MAG: carbamoyl-phosphate synthase large subunit [Phycisphaerales bacterium]|jgi:carbamoyl-phosphate synthase large subunit|nr:carbamoyl-phosphate synthase large subunit [Phycisphaerales bacterium]
MPKRTDIRTILVLGSGPIVIGQGCEFDYSGTQACKALRAEGYRIVLVNSNPATIMTDPAFSDRTYIEPITPEGVRKIIEREKELGDPIDAILPTLGGQTALNCACALFDNGTLAEFEIEMIGANREVIHRAEDRALFKKVCDRVGLKSPDSRTVSTLDEARAALSELGLPAIIRPAFTLGGWGGGIAYNAEEFDELVTRGLKASMITQVQVDRSLLGWKEYELEVVRDRKDNCIIVCGIENIDAMGVHTGDSITVAPILTLTDKEYQALRDAAFAIMREVGVETGGSNVQFAVNPAPKDGKFEFVVVEMNPRVSRSSALASKATGFPIAKIAAKLAVGYTLDELRNDITGTTSACFEPSIDYVVTKMPRWTFEKFPEADETLTTQMKSVGEAMAIGRTLKESLQKVIRSMDVKRFGLGLDRNDKWLTAMRAVEHDQLLLDLTPVATEQQQSATGLRTADGQPIEWPIPTDKLTRKLAVPSQGRIYYVRYAMKMGWSDQKIHQLTRIDHFFLDQIRQLVEFEDVLCRYRTLDELPREMLFEAKRLGYSDAQLANLYFGNITSETILAVRTHRKTLGVEPIYKLVDTCAAEFEAITPYYYSTYEPGAMVVGEDGVAREAAPDNEVRVSEKRKVIILGGGPNRIGQGIEFDYCCVHAAWAARDMGFESVMINSNPETVSTDYDTSDLLFFEPLTLEDVMNVVDRLDSTRSREGGEASLVEGLVVQFGGQTPLNLAHGLVEAGAPIVGTSVDSIDLAEDRDRFDALLERLSINRPPSGIARSLDEARAIAQRIGYPVLVRPSYVLGGRGMEVCADEQRLVSYVTNALRVSDLDGAPVLIDKFLSGATEVDVDVVADFVPDGSEEDQRGRQALVCGVMEHIEHAGIHSGDSSCVVPPHSLRRSVENRIREIARSLARELRVCGLMNAQMAVKDDEVYIIEVNPRASRTAPFVSKAKHIPWPSFAARVMYGSTLSELGAREVRDTGAYAVKESVFPFQKFPGVDAVLGPEMRSTGEVMGIDVSFPLAYAKGQIAASCALPREGNVFLSVRSEDKDDAVDLCRNLMSMGFVVYTTQGTADHLARHGMRPKVLPKIGAGARPNVLDLMTSGEIHLVLNTPTRTGWQTDEGKIRSTAVRLGIPMITTISGAQAGIRAIAAIRAGDWGVMALQDFARLMPPIVEVTTRPAAPVRA